MRLLWKPFGHVSGYIGRYSIRHGYREDVMTFCFSSAPPNEPFSYSYTRSEIGKIPLDTVFRERESLNTNIVQQINIAAEAWGIDCKRYEIRDISVPSRVKEAMQVTGIS